MSANYRPIALSSTFSKVLEQLVLCKYSNIFTSSHLQFGFKPGSSTSLCTGMVKTLFLDIFTMDIRFLVVSWIPLKLLTQLIMVFSSSNCLTEVSLWLLLDFCCLGIVLRSVVFVGVHVFLDLSVFLLVFVKEVFFLTYFLLCIWMACCLTLLRVVLGVIGVICLLVREKSIWNFLSYNVGMAVPLIKILGTAMFGHITSRTDSLQGTEM